MKKTNTIVCGIAFAIPVIYFAVQAFLDKKYLFLILAAMGMIFLAGQMKKIYANESAMTESAQGIWAERETDICIALTALLWVSYICNSLNGILLPKVEPVSLSVESPFPSVP